MENRATGPFQFNEAVKVRPNTLITNQDTGYLYVQPMWGYYDYIKGLNTSIGQ